MERKKKVIVFGSYIFSLVNFRKNLLIDLVARGYEVLTLAPGRDAAVEEELASLGIRFQSIPLSRTGLNPLGDLLTLVEIRNIIRSFRPTLLITYTIKPVIYGNLVAGFYPGIKKLALITGLGYLDTGKKTLLKRIIQRTIHRLYRYALRNLQFIAFQNPDDQFYFSEHDLLTNRTAVTITAGSGVDLSHYKRAKPVLAPATFLLIARLIKAKGIEQYLEAARVLKPECGDRVTFRLIGMLDDENPDSIDEATINGLHREGIIEYLGFQKDVRDSLASSSVFVLPSYYREGTPRTILEALASGKPVITTDNPGCRETVIDGRNGFLIPVKDPVQLANAMRKFIYEPSLIAEMGEESYRLAQTKYNVTLVNKHLFDFAGI